MMKPNLVAAADWSKSWEGRWQVEAVLRDEGYEIAHPRPVGPPEDLIHNLAKGLPAGNSALIGLDFPIGMPREYASSRRCSSFPKWLVEMSDEEWRHFSTPTDDPSLLQPFGPRSNDRDGMKEEDLAKRLGLKPEGLYRVCDRQVPRSGPSPLFFTRFSKQVGKAAIHGWSSLIRRHRSSASIWPFDGRLEELLARSGVVLAEIYPAMGSFAILGRGGRGKNDPSYRRSVAPRLEQEARKLGAIFTEEAAEWIQKGFASGHDFDALIGLLWMLRVLEECDDGGLSGQNPDGVARSVEGWMLGLQAADPDAVSPNSRDSLLGGPPGSRVGAGAFVP